MGEKKIGDVPEIDRKRHKNKAEAEHAAWREMLAELPKEQRDFIYDLLMEFDAQTAQSNICAILNVFANVQSLTTATMNATFSLKLDS